MEIEVNAGTPETPEEAAARKAKLLADWRASIQPKKEWTAYENNARLAVAHAFFPTPVRGTNRVPLEGGEKLKLVHGFTYTLGNKDLVDEVLGEKVPIANQVNALIGAIRALGETASFICEGLIKWEPKLNETAYRNLREDISVEKQIKALVDAILTIKPASPQMEIEPAKGG